MEIVSKLSTSAENILNSVDEERIIPHLKISLSKLIRSEGFLSFKLDTRFRGPCGGNYLGELSTVQITGKTVEDDKVIHLFIKAILPLSYDVDFIPYRDIYVREIFVYKEINVIFEELQTKFLVPDIERYKFVKFYDTANENALIMENLEMKGFKVPERLEIPSLSFNEIAIKQLAKFHALSFVMKRENPRLFEKEVKTKKYLLNFNDTWERIKGNFIKASIETVKNEEAKEKLAKYISNLNIAAKLTSYLKDDHVDIGVFCHGDYRTQNILLQEKDGAARQIMPIDYQFSHYGHPVNDLIFYYFTGATDKDFRLRHMDYLNTLYYDTMKEYLLYFNMDIKEVFPRKQFELNFKERLEYGLLIGIIYFPLFLAPEDDIPNLSMDLATKKFSRSDTFVTCVNELIDDFIEWGYL